MWEGRVSQGGKGRKIKEKEGRWKRRRKRAKTRKRERGKKEAAMERLGHRGSDGRKGCVQEGFVCVCVCALFLTLPRTFALLRKILPLVSLLTLSCGTMAGGPLADDGPGREGGKESVKRNKIPTIVHSLLTPSSFLHSPLSVQPWFNPLFTRYQLMFLRLSLTSFPPLETYTSLYSSFPLPFLDLLLFLPSSLHITDSTTMTRHQRRKKNNFHSFPSDWINENTQESNNKEVSQSYSPNCYPLRGTARPDTSVQHDPEKGLWNTQQR